MDERMRNVARGLRRGAPETERLIWGLLRDRRLSGLKFRRQLVIGPYVVDFACLRHQLVVEADGPFHDPIEDARRDDWLRGRGFRVIRLKNAEVRDLLIPAILSAVAPSPHEGEGGSRRLTDEGSKDLSG